MDIKDKIVMITGGASGLGLATAKHLAARGAKIALLDLNEENLESAPKEIDGETLTFKTNVTEEESVQNAIDQTVEKFGALHGLVNCAGIGSASKTVSKNGAHPLDYFKLVVEINLIGTFNVLRLAAEAMGKNTPETDNECGVIINTASVAAFDGQVFLNDFGIGLSLLLLDWSSLLASGTSLSWLFLVDSLNWLDALSILSLY